jgi:hypothetical protein
MHFERVKILILVLVGLQTHQHGEIPHSWLLVLEVAASGTLEARWYSMSTQGEGIK